MTRTQIVSNCFNAIQSRNTLAAEAYLADEFKFTGAVPQPVGKQEWIKIHAALSKAFPDFSFNLDDVMEQGDRVTANVRITGNHKGDLTLPGFETVKATGKKVALPIEPITVSFKGDKIARVDVTPVPNGGLEGLLEQVGAHAVAHY